MKGKSIHALNFLTDIFKEGKGHSTINTYHSAISMSHSIIDSLRVQVGQHPVVSAYYRGCLIIVPPNQGLLSNVEAVIDHIRNRPPSDCPKICPVQTLREYEKRTSALRKENCGALLIACVKSHKPVATSTVSRWIKAMLREAGIEANAHSTRAAATSAAFAAGLSIKEIMDTACWTNESTFKRFYCCSRAVADSKSLILATSYF